MQYFTISNHPILTDIVRKAELTKMDIDMNAKVLTLYLRIRHYLNDIYIPELDKSISGTAINDNLVEIQPATDTEEAVFMGEFDYLNKLYEQNTPLSELLEQGISDMDISGLVNLKCNYGV